MTESYHVTVVVWPKEGVLDPQARQVLQTLHHLGYPHVRAIRIGKQHVLTIRAENWVKAREQAREIAEKELCNAVIEQFWIAE